MTAESRPPSPSERIYFASLEERRPGGSRGEPRRSSAWGVLNPYLWADILICVSIIITVSGTALKEKRASLKGLRSRYPNKSGQTFLTGSKHSACLWLRFFWLLLSLGPCTVRTSWTLSSSPPSKAWTLTPQITTSTTSLWRAVSPSRGRMRYCILQLWLKAGQMMGDVIRSLLSGLVRRCLPPPSQKSAPRNVPLRKGWDASNLAALLVLLAVDDRDGVLQRNQRLWDGWDAEPGPGREPTQPSSKERLLLPTVQKRGKC